MTYLQVSPSALTFGDQVVINKNLWTVKAVEGPDTIGTYDIYLHDNKTGMDRTEVVAETITLAL